jgi:hypothetical protein
VIAVLLSGSSTTGPLERVAFRALPKGAAATATLEPRSWGSDVTVRVSGFRRGTVCTVWVRRSDGTRVAAGSFRYVYEGESEEAALSAAVGPREAAAIGLRAGSRTFVAPLPPSAADGAASSPATSDQEDT